MSEIHSVQLWERLTKGTLKAILASANKFTHITVLSVTWNGMRAVSIEVRIHVANEAARCITERVIGMEAEDE